MVSQSRVLLRSNRRKQRGATVFVVVLAVTLLTAVGLFAAHSATLVDQAAGYERLARQTQQLAEYGTLAITAELGSGTAGPQVDELKKFSGDCASNASLTEASCYTRSSAQLNERTKELSEETLTKDASGDVENTIGNGELEANFKVEITDPSINVRVAGSDYGSGSNGGFRYVMVTATTFAQVRPVGAGTCNQGLATVSGQQSVRAHLIVGPVQN